MEADSIFRSVLEAIVLLVSMLNNVGWGWTTGIALYNPSVH